MYQPVLQIIARASFWTARTDHIPFHYGLVYSAEDFPPQQLMFML